MPWFTREILSAAGSAIDGWAWLSGEASSVIVNRGAAVGPPRPHAFSTLCDYTSWRSLTDRTYLARHLPPADAPVTPPPEKLAELFRRPVGGQRLSKKSTCLFPAFAQYLTDGFIRTQPNAHGRTTSNHEIDLCPLYGRTYEQTLALRLCSDRPGERGRLKSQMRRDGEYPPFLFEPGTKQIKAEFALLDPPLVSPFQPIPLDPVPENYPDWPGGSQAKIDTLFAMGGDRANSTPFTAMMNTLFLREHNRIAGELEARNPGWHDERVFDTARNIMIPVFIKIVIEQYINHITPLPFSIHADPQVAWTAPWNRPNWITAEFSLLYRWHALMPDSIVFPNLPAIALADFTLDNAPLLYAGLGAAFSAAAAQSAAELGPKNTNSSLVVIEQLSIGQAREMQFDTYNNYRRQFKLDPAESFADISSREDVQALLSTLYDQNPDNVEFYPGLFAEDVVEGAALPALMMTMVALDAFTQAYTNPLLSAQVYNAATFTAWGLDLIENTHKLGDVLQRNGVQVTAPIEMTQPDWTYVTA